MQFKFVVIFAEKKQDMKPKLYQYAIVWHPSSKQLEEGMRSLILVEPKYVLAMDREAALVAAATDVPQEYKDQLDQLDIMVGVFVGQGCVTSKSLTYPISNGTYNNPYSNNFTNLNYNIINRNKPNTNERE